MNFKMALIAVIAVVMTVAIFFRWRLSLDKTLTVTSWWRSDEKNAAVGGVAKSKHLIGWAFDIVPVNDLTIQRLKNIGFAKILNEGDHVHVEII